MQVKNHMRPELNHEVGHHDKEMYRIKNTDEESLVQHFRFEFCNLESEFCEAELILLRTHCTSQVKYLTTNLYT